ncbi:hypothetical protein MA16_Dca017502 [Dendrobium catenatum]|uniref:Uncharacterized protein n=1 Tax=Dendrobium catenatum TaxID=906689 RepID=A0A2I0X301_9ASPA|nr:hypothetical protein MA16_Dca017502 [Dendrobium catenatum]
MAGNEVLVHDVNNSNILCATLFDQGDVEGIRADGANNLSLIAACDHQVVALNKPFGRGSVFTPYAAQYNQSFLREKIKTRKLMFPLASTSADLKGLDQSTMQNQKTFSASLKKVPASKPSPTQN